MSDLAEHAVPEDVSTSTWRLDVTGMVETPLTMDRGDVLDLSLESYTADFSCVEGWQARALSWRGVRGETLLSRATPTPESRYALVHGMDGEYACSFPLDRLADAVFAVELDGDPLPVEHGGPLRLVPTGDSDCWESVKWVAEVELRETRPVEDDTAESIALARVD